MSDSRWYTNRIKHYKDGERDRSQTPTQKRFKKRRASRHNRRSMKQRLIVHAIVIPTHGRVINQTGKTMAKTGKVKPRVFEDTMWICVGLWP